ncbi:Ras GTPase [Orbilia blumenaviensis]|uniref:Ras GTPase n=1 Tax=Orbilia blumenaviensis TaxID=1796055 RepID=A0AAV9TXD3_9PEZI
MFLRQYNLLIIGPPGSGKLNFMVQFMGYRSCWESIEDLYVRDDSHRKQCVIDDEVTILDLSETGDLDTSPTGLTHEMIQNSEGIILMYSITSRETFEMLPTIYEEIRRMKGPHSFQMTIVGNKCDLESKRVVLSEEGQDMAEVLGAGFYECSARTRVNIDQSVYDLVRRVRDSGEPEEPQCRSRPNRCHAELSKHSEGRRRRSWLGGLVDRVIKRGK